MRYSCTLRRHLFRRVVCHKCGGPEELSVEEFTAKDIAVGPDEVLVRNGFAGVNYIDTYFRSGLYTKPNSTSRGAFGIGEEGCGAIVKAGENVPVSRLGERVAFFQNISGSYSSFVVLRAEDAFPVPPTVSDEIGAASLLQGLTAHYLTSSVYPVTAGDVVLVHAAAGGTGLFLSQVCRALGATVIGTCGGQKKAAIANQFGSLDVVIDYHANPDWKAEVRAKFPQGVHCVYDGIGRTTFHQSLAILRRRGFMVTFGNASGPVAPISPLLLTQHGSLVLQRPSLKDFVSHEDDEVERRVDQVWQWVSGSCPLVKVAIGAVLPLQKAQTAHEMLEGRQSHGKVLLNCQE